jgi:hypothetical protein
MSIERRLVALCASARLRSWIEAEVSDLVKARFYASTVRELVELLTRGGASESELIVLDLDLLSAPQTLELEAGLDERWWHGKIVGLGSVRGVHRRHLSIDRALDRPLGSEALRAYVESSETSDTQPIVEWPNAFKKRGAIR